MNSAQRFAVAARSHERAGNNSSGVTPGLGLINLTSGVIGNNSNANPNAANPTVIVIGNNITKP